MEFRVCDARELDKMFNSYSFDAVTMFFTSIAYMTELDDLVRLLKSVRHVLRKGGVFVADSANPYEFMSRLGSRCGENSSVTWDTEGLEGDEHLVIIEWKEIAGWVDCINRFNALVTIVREGGVTESYLVSDTHRLYMATEFVLVAKLAGFSESRAMCYFRGQVLEPGAGGRCSCLLFIAIA